MLTATAVGRIKEARIANAGQTRILEAKVVTRRKGFGQRASETFEVTIKAKMFGKAIDEVIKQLTPGRLVEVIGEPEAEGYLGKQDNKPKGALVIRGTIAVSCDDAPITPRAQPQTQRAAAPAAEPPADLPPEGSDLPF